MAVTVYARGALVTRRVELPEALPAGPILLTCGGVSPVAEPGSMRADLQGGRDLLGVASRVVVPSSGEVSGELTRRLRELRLEHERLERLRDDLRARAQMLDDVGISVGMKPRRISFDVAARTADALAAVELGDELRGDLDVRLREVEQQLRVSGRALAAAELEANQASSTERAGEGHPVREIAVRIGGGDAAIERLEVTYTIALARWWPTYTVRLDEDNRTAELSAEAWVAQLSYEDWSDVELALSTADLHRDTELPELPEWRMGRAQPPVRSGYRSPPPNLDALFTGWDEAMVNLPPSGAAEGSGSRGGVITGEAAIDGTRTQAGQLMTRTMQLAPERPSSDVLPTTEVSYAELGFGGADEDRSMAVDVAEMAPPSGAMARYAPMANGAPPGYGGAGMTQQAMMAPAPVKRRSRSGGRGAADKMKKSEVSALDDEFAADGDADAAIDLPTEIEPEAGWLDFDRLVLSAGDGSPGRRGRLRVREQSATHALEAAASTALRQSAPPGAVRDPRESRGEFDHLYRAVSTVDVPSSAAPHRVSLATEEGKSRPRFRCVPVESSEVYREIELDNPFDAPLLTGPLDVFVGGAMVTTSTVDAVDRGGRIVFGLGVEERLRVARKPRFAENKGGIFGGRVGLEHHISIELASALGYDAKVDVVDRVPTTTDDEIEIERLDASPAPRKYDQAERGEPVEGGLRWRVTVPAGGSTTIDFGYLLKLSAKREIIGGNRRD